MTPERCADLLWCKTRLCKYCKELDRVDCKGCKVAELANAALDETENKNVKGDT